MESSLHQVDRGIVPASPGRDFQDSPVVPRLCVGPARAMYVGPGLNLDPHLNVAATLAVSLQEPFTLRTWLPRGGWSPWRPGLACVIASQTLHHLRSSGPMVFLYLDPWADRGALPGDEQLHRGRERLLAAGPQVGIEQAFAAFGLAPCVPRDARIAKVVQAIEREPAAFARLQDAAALACLSPSRFRARFDAEVGVPFRRYRLWRRMAAVMHSIAAGGTLTEAALASGFASSAHLSSAFKRMFGLSPRQVLALGLVLDVREGAVTAGQRTPPVTPARAPAPARTAPRSTPAGSSP